MGGKMNLNPLKKDDNTDALVKALEDANSTEVDAASPVVQAADPVAPVAPATDGVTDGAVIAADPQITGDPIMSSDDTTVQAPQPAEEATTAPTGGDAVVGTTDQEVSIDDSQLPEGISSDADAHLSAEGTGDDGELDSVKKDALEQLRPLIEKLDLEPADKFDKYLMMLRASDDPALIKPAFEAAQGIPGEKEKAQALLDIINEINYITASKQQ